MSQYAELLPAMPPTDATKINYFAAMLSLLLLLLLLLQLLYFSNLTLYRMVMPIGTPFLKEKN